MLEEQFKSICRVCMTSNAALVSFLQDTTLSDLLLQAAGLKIKMDDILPKQICSTCILDAKFVLDFKNRCHDSDAKLHSMASLGVKHDLDLKYDFNNCGSSESLQCSLCLESFASAKDLTSHSSSHFTTEQLEGDFIKSEELIVLEIDKYDESETELYKNEDFANDTTFSDQAEEILCTICNDMFPSKKKLRHHMKDHHPSLKPPKLKYKVLKRIHSYNKAKCSECNIKFRTKAAFQAHCSQEHKWTTKCYVCYKVFDNKRVYRRHKCVSKIELPNKCSICNNRFRTLETLGAHMAKQHTNRNKTYSCDICKIKFESAVVLNGHIEEKHAKEGGRYECGLCFKRLPSAGTLKAHEATHLVNDKFKCPECPRNFKLMTSLLSHMKYHPKPEQYLCFLCGKSMKTKAALVEHDARHNGVKQYTCDYCHKSFVTKGEIIAHFRHHTGEHPFVCDVCGGAFTTSSALTKHRRRHTGSKPHACDLCPKRFLCMGVLKNHRRTHTGEKPFKCTYCPKAFCKNSNLKSHERTHTNEHPYSCQTCGQSFKQSQSLRMHCKQRGHDKHRTAFTQNRGSTERYSSSSSSVEVKNSQEYLTPTSALTSINCETN